MLQRAARPPLRRIQTIDHHVRAGVYPNAETLAAELEVNPRTIQRDIEFMRDQLRAPLDFCRQHNGYRYTAPTFQLPFFQFSEGELVAFFLAERLLRQYRGTPYESDLRRAFDRVASLLPDEISINLAGLGNTLSVTPTVLAKHDIETFRLLAQAVTDRRPLEIDYWTASRDVVTTRRIDPYHLTLIDNDWYVVAYCHFRSEVRMFSPVRIRAATLVPGSFTRPESFDVADYLGDSFRAVRGHERHEVTLRFTSTVAGRVEEKTWHKTQRLEKQPDGSLLMHLTVSDLIELKRWVLSWGRECEVLGPGELREQLRQEATNLAATYRKVERR